MRRRLPRRVQVLVVSLGLVAKQKRSQFWTFSDPVPLFNSHQVLPLIKINHHHICNLKWSPL